MTPEHARMIAEAIEGYDTPAGRLDLAMRLRAKLELIERYEAGMEEVCSDRCARLAIENADLRHALERLRAAPPKEP